MFDLRRPLKGRRVQVAPDRERGRADVESETGKEKEDEGKGETAATTEKTKVTGKWCE